MKYNRMRSEFWINIYANDDASYNISTNGKYINIINAFFPILEQNSPTKWRESKKYGNMWSLWLPEGHYSKDVMNDFIHWCESVINDVLWLGLNKNIDAYFSDELDYCIASDFNYVYGGSRTETGEAEYQLKYHIGDLKIEERKEYVNVIMEKMLVNCKYIPLGDRLNWCVSPMPATESGRKKLAWQMAKAISKKLQLPFVTPDLNADKPQMKQLSIKDKIDTWDKIYSENGVILDSQIKGKQIMVVDDLYQSGATMWEYAKFLKEQGAECVFGVVCVKSLKDSDNT